MMLVSLLHSAGLETLTPPVVNCWEQQYWSPPRESHTSWSVPKMFSRPSGLLVCLCAMKLSVAALTSGGRGAHAVGVLAAGARVNRADAVGAGLATVHRGGEDAGREGNDNDSGELHFE